MNLKAERIDGLTFTLDAYAVRGARTIWLNPDSPFAADGPLTFAERFAYLLPGQKVFQDVPLDETRRTPFSIDRYGGHGMGTNGGSGRAGSFGDVQIKGIGRTPLVGADNPPDHLTGDLNVYDALYEATMASVFGHVLPVGTAMVHGVIYVGDQAAFAAGEGDASVPAPGCLLVREAKLRPAHFLRAPRFRAPKSLPSDVERVERACLDLTCQLGSPTALDEWVRTFAMRCAAQMAYARLACIAHGVLSPSNIAVDGSWLDLTNVSFLPSRTNAASLLEHVPFQAEAKMMSDYVTELLATAAKYNRTMIDPKNVLETYGKQFRSWTLYHTPEIIGLVGLLDWEDMRSPECRSLNRACEAVVGGGEKVAYTPTDVSIDDPLTLFLADAFVPRTKLPEERSSVSHNLNVLLDSLSVRLTVPSRSLRRWALIRALKRSLYRGLFTRGQQLHSIRTSFDSSALAEAGQLIDDQVAASRWVFDRGIEPVVTIFRGNGVELLYDREQDAFLCGEVAGDATACTAAEARSWARHQGALRIGNWFATAAILFMLDLLAEDDADGSVRHVAQ